MKKKVEGFALHVHHDVLIEGCYGYEERIEIIKTQKPPKERELRSKLFQIIPNRYIPKELVKAWDANKKARDAYEEAWDANEKARDANEKAWDANKKARDAYKKARDAYETLLAKYMPTLEALHAKLCPDCPWNGKTIFTRKNDKGEWY